MYLAYNLKSIEKLLKKESASRSFRTKRVEVKGNYTGFLTAGDLTNVISTQAKIDQKYRKVIGILFADPNVSIAKKEVVPHLDYLYHLTDIHLDFFCAGYNAYLPPDENSQDNKMVVTNVNDTPWKFSTKAFIELEREIESISKWKKGDGCSLLLFDVVVSKGSVDYDFENCLDWNLKTMIENKDISSVRKLVDNIVEAIKRGASTYKASDDFGLEILGECVKESLLTIIPENVRGSYRKAEHFTVKNYSKK